MTSKAARSLTAPSPAEIARLRNAQGEKEVLRALRDLENVKVTSQMLVDTGLGKQANKFRKHKNKEISSLAKSLVKKWKLIFKGSTSGSKRGLTSQASVSSASSKKQKLEIPVITPDSEKKYPKLATWHSDDNNLRSSYKVEEKINPKRVRLVDTSTYHRDRAQQLDIGVKAKVKPLKLVHPGKGKAAKKNWKLTSKKGPVVYWMSRDQRSEDNWALLFAQQYAEEIGSGLVVAFNLVPTFLEATGRHYGFMLRGLTQVQTALEERNIPFHTLYGNPKDTIPQFIKDHDCPCLISDFSPMRIAYLWKDQVLNEIGDVPFYEVDAHNVVPVWYASDKLEYGARTIRKRIHSKLEEYLTRFPALRVQDETKLLKEDLRCAKTEKISFKKLAETKKIAIDLSVPEVRFCDPGEGSAQKVCNDFMTSRVKDFDAKRNNPNFDKALSGLSPYLHFGQVAPQRVILEAYEAKQSFKNKPNITKSLDGFIEEAMVRRELAENYCFYNADYDNLKGCWKWARTTLDIHKHDKRDKVYTREQLENAKTHDKLWNAAQQEMVHVGKMHGFLRMYWAKKILEWSPNPEEALANAIYLNDRYSIDGRDPNGYVGVMWSIAGIHDQGWRERPVFGKIRYMNYDGCKRKFDISSYVSKIKRVTK